MGKGDVGRNAAAETLDDATRAAVRSAVSSALTAPTNLDWRAAGRLEHATFATLGDIESRARRRPRRVWGRAPPRTIAR